MDNAELQQILQYSLDCHRKGMHREAEAGYRRALEIHPDFPDALHLLGVIAYQKGDHVAAESLIRRSVQVAPGIPVYHSSLGLVLLAMRRKLEAVSEFKIASEMNPTIPEFFTQLGAAYFQTEQLELAEQASRRAIALAPNNAEAYYNLGNSLIPRDRLTEALDAYAMASRLRPNWAPPVTNQAVALRRMERYDEAAECFKTAIALTPGDANLYGNLGSVIKDLGLLEEAVETYRKGLAIKPDSDKTFSNLILTLFYIPDLPRKVIDAELEAYEARVAGPLRGPAMAHRPAKGRKIRVGFFSPDFRMHPAGVMAAPVMGKLNRDIFEVFGYGEMLWRDEWTAVCQRSVNVFRETHLLHDDQVDAMIRNDQLDILVDLASHTAGGRLTALARKPAPIMGTWLAYCESTGMKAMDFRISDPWMDPADFGGVEKVVRLPMSYWCYPNIGMAMDPGDLPAKTAGRVTFGCLNSFCKINRKVILVFAAILGKIRDSQLLLSSPAGSARGRLLNQFSELGVDPSRIQFVERELWDNYFKVYRRIDIALDVFPFNGGMTTCDALWMGVPVVNLIGQRGVARAGWSILNNIGMPELAGNSAEEYVKIACDLAGDLSRLQQIRKELRARMIASPLMDLTRFTRDMETALLGLLPFEASPATIGA